MNYKRHQLTDEDRAKLEGSTVTASISGGKDSAALSLWLTEQGIEHNRVFANTEWEHPLTYKYLRGELTRIIGPIDEVKCEKGGFADRVLAKGTFPGRLRRWCTEELKTKPLALYLLALDSPINAVGIRGAESSARAAMPRWEYWKAGDCDVWRPLKAWTEQDVIDIHAAHGLLPNPLYLKGARRVGCWPCIFSRKSEIRQVAELTPERIDEIRDLEAKVKEIAMARHEAAGTEPILGWPAMFVDKGRRQIPVPIDKAVEWSRTARGGKQLLLLETEPPGCVRWGLCESLAPGDED